MVVVVGMLGGGDAWDDADGGAVLRLVLFVDDAASLPSPDSLAAAGMVAACFSHDTQVVSVIDERGWVALHCDGMTAKRKASTERQESIFAHLQHKG